MARLNGIRFIEINGYRVPVLDDLIKYLGGGGDAAYWGQLHKALNDPTTIEAFLEANYATEQGLVEIDEELHEVIDQVEDIMAELSLLVPKVERALLLPVAQVTSTELVGIGTTNKKNGNEQLRIKLGNGLVYDPTTQTISVQGGGGYEPDNITIQLTKDNKLQIVDNDKIARYNNDGNFSGHQIFNGNVQVNYGGSETHYGANTMTRNTSDGSTYIYTFPNRNGTWATEEWVESKVQTKYIHRVKISGVTPKSPFTSDNEVTLIIVNKAANSIDSYSAIAANIDNIVDGQIYDTTNHTYAKYNLSNKGTISLPFIVLGATNTEITYSSEDFDAATFEDTKKIF